MKRLLNIDPARTLTEYSPSTGGFIPNPNPKTFVKYIGEDTTITMIKNTKVSLNGVMYIIDDEEIEHSKGNLTVCLNFMDTCDQGIEILPELIVMDYDPDIISTDTMLVLFDVVNHKLSNRHVVEAPGSLELPTRGRPGTDGTTRDEYRVQYTSTSATGIPELLGQTLPEQITEWGLKHFTHLTYPEVTMLPTEIITDVLGRFYLNQPAYGKNVDATHTLAPYQMGDITTHTFELSNMRLNPDFEITYTDLVCGDQTFSLPTKLVIKKWINGYSIVVFDETLNWTTIDNYGTVIPQFLSRTTKRTLVDQVVGYHSLDELDALRFRKYYMVDDVYTTEPTNVCLHAKIGDDGSGSNNEYSMAFERAIFGVYTEDTPSYTNFVPSENLLIETNNRIKEYGDIFTKYPDIASLISLDSYVSEPAVAPMLITRNGVTEYARLGITYTDSHDGDTEDVSLILTTVSGEIVWQYDGQFVATTGYVGENTRVIYSMDGVGMSLQLVGLEDDGEDVTLSTTVAGVDGICFVGGYAGTDKTIAVGTLGKVFMEFPVIEYKITTDADQTITLSSPDLINTGIFEPNETSAIVGPGYRLFSEGISGFVTRGYNYKLHPAEKLNFKTNHPDMVLPDGAVAAFTYLDYENNATIEYSLWFIHLNDDKSVLTIKDIDGNMMPGTTELSFEEAEGDAIQLYPYPLSYNMCISVGNIGRFFQTKGTFGYIAKVGDYYQSMEVLANSPFAPPSTWTT